MSIGWMAGVGARGGAGGETRHISTTCALFGEPMKKKKRIDPQLLKMKVDRKIRKLEKSIRKLQKTPQQLKPLAEYQLAPNVLKELKARTRKDPEAKAVALDVEKLNQIWILYRREQALEEIRCIQRVVEAKEKALDLLKSHSVELYTAALAIDEELVPFQDMVVIKDNPKNDNYRPPDGQKTDVTKQWSM